MDVMFDMIGTFPSRVTILGAARSGIAAAKFLRDRGVTVFLSDRCPQEKLEKIIAENGLAGVTFEAQKHTEAALKANLIILSPGVPSDLPVVVQAKKLSIPVWSEMELGFRVSRAPFLAVTGSTGKSTTVSLVGSALASAGIEHVVAGNIGLPVIGLTPNVSQKGFVVAEVSSFQLETIERFHPKAAVVTNLTKNHLDRYPSEEAYCSAKMEISRNLTQNDYLILNACDARLFSWGKEMSGRVRIVYFGANVPGHDSFWCDGTIMMYRFTETCGTLGDCRRMKLQGRHNFDNASAAAVLAKIAGAPDEAIFDGLSSFKGLPHRLEFVAEIDGVRWYNDSKSTTAESIDCAVRSFDGNVHLIAGGKDKGCDFSVVGKAVKERVKSVVLIGEAAARIESQWKGLAPIIRALTLQDAIEKMISGTRQGDTVVFSPGCSSFDMFRDFEDRGEQFCLVVRKYAGREMPNG